MLEDNEYHQSSYVETVQLDLPQFPSAHFDQKCEFLTMVVLVLMLSDGCFDLVHL